MQHVFGMAKSSLNLDGAKRQKLELDYLRLVYACRMLPGSKAYLVVASDKIKKTVQSWEKKYQSAECVDVLLLEPHLITVDFVAEKARNKTGMAMAASLIGEFDKADCSGSIGETVCEKYLAEIITKRLKGNVIQEFNFHKFPLKVKWDYYGITA